ncbi:MAG: hypothetical protein MJ237_01710 [bacterium]|nr:hypothetical protein [bacterium]
MNSQQDVIYGIMNELEEALERGMPLLTNFSIVKKDVVVNILDRLYDALPDEIKEARALLRRRDEFQYEAQQKAEKIITDAQAEANRILSESDLLRAMQKEADKVRDQVISECEEIKRKALDEASSMRNQAIDESLRIKDSASVYAEQILAGLEQNINHVHEVIKENQILLEKKRAEEDGMSVGTYANQESRYAQDFQMH